MPQSRKRPGHPYHKPADIPASQRVRGRIIWMLLFGAFGMLIALFSAGGVLALSIGLVLGAGVGWLAGKSMEQQARG